MPACSRANLFPNAAVTITVKTLRVGFLSFRGHDESRVEQDQIEALRDEGFEIVIKSHEAQG